MTPPIAPSLASMIAGVAIAVSVAALPARAQAAEVLVVRPPAADAFVDEIFHRVGGELALHGFAVRPQDAAPGADDLSLSEARALLARTGADACVGFLARGEASVVRVWVAGKGGAPSLFEAVSLRRTPDAPTILAARAVDLLTAALGQPAPPPPPPRQPPPEPAPEKPSRFVLGVGGALVGRGAGFGVGAGPLLSLAGALSPRLWLGARLVGPTWGRSHDNAEAGASLTQGMAEIDLAATLAAAGPLAIRARVGLGAGWLHAVGHVDDPAIASLVSNSDTGWMLAGSLGLQAVVAVTARVAVGVTGNLTLLAPRPAVTVGRETVRPQQPQPSLSLDARFGF